MSIEKILLNSDATVTAGLQEIAKILTATEGKDTTNKRDEIFSILLGIGTIRGELKSFSQRKEANVVNILSKWVEAQSVIDVIDLKHGKAQWYFVLRAARIPKAIYQTSTPEKVLQTVANGILQTFTEKVFYVYGDSRINTDNSDPDFCTVSFFMAFKAGVIPQGY